MAEAKTKTLDYLYGTKEEREQTAVELLAQAKTARSTVENLWKTYANFYRGNHNIHLDGDEEVSNDLVDDTVICDAYTQIESQIDTNMPEPMFRGREKSDVNKAKQREYVVKSILYKNDFKAKMTVNERLMRLNGDSFVKVYFDENVDFDGGMYNGDIVVDVIDTEDIYPDPAATSIDNCEYIDFVYRVHKRKAMREWGKAIKKAGIDIENICGSGQIAFTPSGKRISSDEIEIQEHWYRDDEGDIACSILVDGTEIKHIDKYWSATGAQNKNYPFVQFWRIKTPFSFWNESELRSIIPLIKTGDVILQSGLLNMQYNANDQLIVEPDSLIENEEITTEPGGIINVKQGTSAGAVRRLSGLNKLNEFLSNLQFIQTEIQKTCRNYDTNNGKETSKQNTASGLAMLRADAATQASIKDADRLNAFERMFRLIDWTALEFYDDDRLIYLGVPNKANRADMADGNENLDDNIGDVFFKFNSITQQKTRTEHYIDESGVHASVLSYYPPIDVEVNATAGIQKSKTYTLSALQAILQTQVTETNYKIVIAVIRELEIPQSEEIIDALEQMYSPNRGSGNTDLDGLISQLSPDQQATMRANPALMKQLSQEYSSKLGGNVYADSTGTI